MSTTDNQAGKSKSLTEVSAEKLLQYMRKAEDPVKYWFELDDIQQKLVFPHLWKDYGQLFEYARSIKKRLPRADKQVFTSGVGLHKINSWSPTDSEFEEDRRAMAEAGIDPLEVRDDLFPFGPHLEVNKDGLIDLNSDPYRIKNHFRRQWVWLEPESKDKPEETSEADSSGQNSSSPVNLSQRETVQDWGDFDLYREPGSDRLLVQDYDKKVFFPDTFWLANEISSQLLHYRLLAVFGAPANENFRTDGYKETWRLKLMLREYHSSQIHLYNHKGCSSAAFFGSARASEMALQLLQWLISDNVPHTYDYTLCGRVA